MVNDPLVFTAQSSFDPGDPSSRGRAHAMVDSLFDALGDDLRLHVTDGTASSVGADAATRKTDRVVLGVEELRKLLHNMAVGHEATPLNEGERQMLAAIAERAPRPLSYEDNKVLLGTGAKFGNVSSGLARRFWNRGYELPYAPDPTNTGYVMTPEVAHVVNEVLDGTRS